VVSSGVKSPSVKFPIDVSAVAFDLDGTLVDTLPDLHASANRMLADLGLTPVDAETVRAYIGRGIDRLVKRLLAGVPESHPGGQSGGNLRVDPGGNSSGEPDPVLLAEAGTIFRGHYRELLTNESRLFGLGVLHLFDEVISGDTLERKKPDPLPLTCCAQRFGIAPERPGMELHELDCDAIVQVVSELFELIRPIRP